jgi:SAM-dependent methyltransferase
MISIRYLPKYLADRRRFRKAGGEILCSVPILAEFRVEAGTASGHYFHQDLLVASLIAKANPMRHIDVGSRIDGFVAHVACFREIEVLDVRSLEPTGHDHIRFVQADLMKDDMSLCEAADSVSCLHAIEHFGLGRYGDSIDPNGHMVGFRNIVNIPKPGGTLYISFPIGDAPGVHFNAHRVFHPREILTWPGSDRLELIRFDFVDDGGKLQTDFPLLQALPSANYGCGIYTFRKRS